MDLDRDGGEVVIVRVSRNRDEGLGEVLGLHLRVTRSIICLEGMNRAWNRPAPFKGGSVHFHLT